MKNNTPTGNPFFDSHTLLSRFQTYEAFNSMDDVKKKQFLDFRMSLLKEEVMETFNAYKAKDAEELVDGMIDMMVIISGTLKAFDVDASKAWNEVFRANISKEVGFKEGRSNEFGMPDLMKPEGWVAPDHSDNHGQLDTVFEKGDLPW